MDKWMSGLGEATKYLLMAFDLSWFVLITLSTYTPKAHPLTRPCLGGEVVHQLVCTIPISTDIKKITTLSNWAEAHSELLSWQRFTDTSLISFTVNFSVFFCLQCLVHSWKLHPMGWAGKSISSIPCSGIPSQFSHSIACKLLTNAHSLFIHCWGGLPDIMFLIHCTSSSPLSRNICSKRHRVPHFTFVLLHRNKLFTDHLCVNTPANELH